MNRLTQNNGVLDQRPKRINKLDCSINGTRNGGRKLHILNVFQMLYIVTNVENALSY